MKKYNYDPSKIFYPKEELNQFIESKTIKHLIETKPTKHHYENKIVIGDGLEAMAAMEFGRNQNEVIKVDIVIIDPPYNEDKSGGKYQDQWKGSGKDFAWAGENHGAYLDYLHPRIVLGKNALTDEGCMMLFIGDGEQHRVRLLMEMVFGEKNYIGTIVWDSNWSPTKNKLIHRKHEYCIIFCKNIKSFKEIGGLHKIENNNKNPKNKLAEYAKSLLDIEDFKTAESKYLDFYNKMKENQELTGDSLSYKYILPKTYEIFMDAASNAPDSKNRPRIPLLHPITESPCTIPTKGWRYSTKFLTEINNIDNFFCLHDKKIIKLNTNQNSERVKGIIFGTDETTIPRTIYIHNNESNKKVLSTSGHIYDMADKKKGITSNFETVKPYEFLKELILNYPNKNAIILDFFAGSGTTAIATEFANNEDAGNRKWVMVEMNEDTVNETMIPRFNHFDIQNYKILKIEECEINEEKLLKYFSHNLENHLKAKYNYKEIDEELNFINILGIDKEQLIFYKKPDNIDLPRISNAIIFFKKIVNKYDLKLIKAYIINKEFISIFEDLKQNLKDEGIILEISAIPEEFQKNWNNNLNILTGERR